MPRAGGSSTPPGPTKAATGTWSWASSSWNRAISRRSEKILTAIAESRPGDPVSVNILAASIYPQERYDESVELLERAHELDSESVVIGDNLVKAKAASAAEVLGANARNVRPQPQ